MNNISLQHGVHFKLKYVGHLLIPKPEDRSEVVAAMRRLRYQRKALKSEKQDISMVVNVDSVKIRSNEEKKPKKWAWEEREMLLMCHPIYRIFYVCHDTVDTKIFCYVTKEDVFAGGVDYKCHVFKAWKERHALQIVQTIVNTFEAYQEKELQAPELPKLKPPSGHEKRHQSVAITGPSTSGCSTTPQTPKRLQKADRNVHLEAAPASPKARLSDSSTARDSGNGSLQNAFALEANSGPVTPVIALAPRVNVQKSEIVEAARPLTAAGKFRSTPLSSSFKDYKRSTNSNNNTLDVSPAPLDLSSSTDTMAQLFSKHAPSHSNNNPLAADNPGPSFAPTIQNAHNTVGSAGMGQYAKPFQVAGPGSSAVAMGMGQELMRPNQPLLTANGTQIFLIPLPTPVYLPQPTFYDPFASSLHKGQHCCESLQPMSNMESLYYSTVPIAPPGFSSNCFSNRLHRTVSLPKNDTETQTDDDFSDDLMTGSSTEAAGGGVVSSIASRVEKRLREYTKRMEALEAKLAMSSPAASERGSGDRKASHSSSGSRPSLCCSEVAMSDERRSTPLRSMTPQKAPAPLQPGEVRSAMAQPGKEAAKSRQVHWPTLKQLRQQVHDENPGGEQAKRPQWPTMDQIRQQLQQEQQQQEAKTAVNSSLYGSLVSPMVKRKSINPMRSMTGAYEMGAGVNKEDLGELLQLSEPDDLNLDEELIQQVSQVCDILSTSKPSGSVSISGGGGGAGGAGGHVVASRSFSGTDSAHNFRLAPSSLPTDNDLRPKIPVKAKLSSEMKTSWSEVGLERVKGETTSTSSNSSPVFKRRPQYTTQGKFTMQGNVIATSSQKTTKLNAAPTCESEIAPRTPRPDQKQNVFEYPANSPAASGKDNGGGGGDELKTLLNKNGLRTDLAFANPGAFIFDAS